MNKNIFYPVLAAFLLLGAGLFAVDTDGRTTELLAKAGFQIPSRKVTVPDFTLEKLEGESASLSSYRGKVVFLNFWATWCPPCRAEMPSMEEVYGQFKDSGFEIVAVNSQESRQTVQKFMSDNGYSFPVLLDTTGRIGSIYGVRGIPTTFVVDRDGTLLGMTVGGREWNDERMLEVLRHLTRDER